MSIETSKNQQLEERLNRLETRLSEHVELMNQLVERIKWEFDIDSISVTAEERAEDESFKMQAAEWDRQAAEQNVLREAERAQRDAERAQREDERMKRNAERMKKEGVRKGSYNPAAHNPG
jgi:hypothetical protein